MLAPQTRRMASYSDMGFAPPPNTRIRKLAVDEALFEEDDPADALFIVRTGTLAIRKKRGNSFVELGKVFSNEVLGEVAFFDRKPRSASAVAVRKSEVIELPFEALDKVYSEIPSYFRTIIAALAERLRKADDALKKFKNDANNQGPGDDDSTDREAEVLSAAADILEGSTALAGEEPSSEITVDPELEAELLGKPSSQGDGA